MDPAYFANNFNTQLTPQQEADYKLWLAGQSQMRGRDMSQDTNDYDMRGYFKAGKGLDGDSGHFPDTFKKPNHPTFSDESMYHNTPAPDGKTYVGGKWGTAKGVDTYTPAPEMFQNTHDPRSMQQYFQRYEPGARLILPQ